MVKLSEKKGRSVNEFYLAACKARDREDFKEALKSINAALACFPKGRTNFKLLITKGGILENLKNYSQAKRIARRAIETKPNHWAGWLLLGSIDYALQKYDKAAYCFKKAIRTKPDFNLYTLLANSELAFDPKAALRDAKNALKLNPKWEEAIRIRDKAKALLEKE